MSAIFGRYSFDDRPVHPATLRSMQEAMAYWGPDGDGLWSEGPVGLGCLRRVNTPESVGEILPWVCPDSGDVITASARLDNRDELLKALSIPHPDRANLPDSHVIFAAYHRWGRQCVDRLVGDWVFAIWNARERCLFIARDHHGNTGLYYHVDSRRFTFASSLKGLLALPEVSRRPNQRKMVEILVSWPLMGPQSCYEGIFHLPPAHAMTVAAAGMKVERYWYLEHTPDLRLRNDEEYLEAFLEVYAEAVRCRLRCSAPVGVTLSGGLDSGSVAALAAAELAQQGRRLPAYSSVPVVDTEPLVAARLFGDETPYIEATARLAGNIDVNYITAEAVSPLEGVERSLSIHDQPLHAAGNMFWISALLAEAQRNGLGALLTGQMGNGTVSWSGGVQPSALDSLAKLQWGAFGRKLKAWQEMTGRSLWSAVRSQVVRPLLRHVTKSGPPAEPPRDAWRKYSAINLGLARELDITGQMERQGHDPTFTPKRDANEARMFLLKPGRSTVGHFYHEVGAAYGLEVRDPTADRRVMSFCWSIPQSQYARDGRDRMLIRRAMEGYLPDEVRWNRHKGAQAADIGQRVLDHRDEIGKALARVERSDLARHYLDLQRMRGVFESVQQGIDPGNNSQCGPILLRGLAVGLFLLRFD